jgi:hypothetical protein
MLQVVVLETPVLLKFLMLIRTIEGSSVHGHVIRGTCSEGTQLWQFNMVTYLENWSRIKFRGVIGFL